MRQKVFLCCVIVAGLSTLMTACRSGEPIDYETALGLLKDRTTDPVKLTFSASPPPDATPAISQAYDRLIDAHIITCTSTKGMGKICQPGPAGEAVSQAGSAELAVIAGRWVPSAIASISRSAGSSATAEVRMQFEMSELYREFEDAFDTIQIRAGKSLLDNKKEGKMAHAVFQRDEDGWHVESVS